MRMAIQITILSARNDHEKIFIKSVLKISQKSTLVAELYRYLLNGVSFLVKVNEKLKEQNCTILNSYS